MKNSLIDSCATQLNKREFIGRFEFTHFVVGVNLNFMYFYLIDIKKHEKSIFYFAYFSKSLFLIIFIIQAMFDFGLRFKSNFSFT